METTTNYKLPQWVKADQIKMDDFNGAFANIDAALKANADAAAGAASAAVVTALAQDVGAGGKNCRIAWGSYVGNGQAGESNKRTLATDFVPLLLIVGCQSDITSSRGVTPMIMLKDCAVASQNTFTGAANYPTVVWAPNSVSWYAEHSTIMLNSENSKYHYVVLGYTEG